MAYDEKKIVTLGILKSAMVRLRADYLASITGSGHVLVQVVDSLPDAADADENVLYLVMNQESGRYDIFKLIDGAFQDLGDSTEELADYIRKDELDTDMDEALEDNIATDDEADEMFDEIFGADPKLKLTVDTDIDAAEDLFGKTVSDLQSGIAIGASAITGTLAYQSDYTGFSSVVEMQTGNYIAIHATAVASDDDTVEPVITVTVTNPVTLDSDGIAVLRIADKDTQTITVTASASGYESVSKTYDLTGLTCETTE